MRRRRLRSVLGAFVSIVVLVVIVAFATGRLSFVTTSGISMLPRFHTGDLVILRSAPAYHVGEIVAYRSPLLHTTVLHRIIANQHGLFTFKGDNNSFNDPLKLPASAINGTMLLHVPRVGSVVSWLQVPLHAALALLVVFSLFAYIETRRKLSRDRRRGTRAPSDPSTEPVAISLLVIGILGFLAFGALTIAVQRVPANSSVTVSTPITERLAFTYAATTPASTTYPTGRVSTGQPVFLKLVHELFVQTRYTLNGVHATNVQGAISLQAVVTEGDGWSHVLVQSTPLSLTSQSGSAMVALPLDQALALVKRSATDTGIQGSGQALTLTSTVALHGTVDGQPIAESDTSHLVFAMSNLELSLQSQAPAGQPPAYPQLVNIHSGTIQHEVAVPGSLIVFGHGENLQVARFVGPIGWALATVLAGVGAFLLWKRRSTSEEERARRRIARDLVPVTSNPINTARRVIDVETLDSLANLADRFDATILDYHDGSEHCYFVVNGKLTYRYQRAIEATSITPLPGVVA